MHKVRSFMVAAAVAGLGLGLSAQQIPRTPAVDQAAHDRGRAIWARECVDCHGTQARGGTGPNIIRTRTVNFDRSSPTAGSVSARS